MNQTSGRWDAGTFYASQPIQLSSLKLEQRPEQLDQLEQLGRQCSQGAECSAIDETLSQLRNRVRSSALDEKFSVAVRERWQTWSRAAKPFRRDLAFLAASETPKDLIPESVAVSESSQDSSNDGDSDGQPEDIDVRPKKKARDAIQAAAKTRSEDGNYAHITDDWERIRQDREALLADMDAKLPQAFIYGQNQLMVYAKRLKPKFLNSLDRPYDPAEIHRALHGACCFSSPPNSIDSDAALQRDNKPVVLTISLFTSHLHAGSDDAAEAEEPSPEPEAGISGPFRDDYISKVAGGGPAGMRRSQTVEILSCQTLGDFHRSLFCWSDEQPERVDWRIRLQAKETMSKPDALLSDEPPTGNNVKHGNEAVTVAVDEDGQEMRFGRFTGRYRQTDAIFAIEDKVYGRLSSRDDHFPEESYVERLQMWRQEGQASGNKLHNLSRGGDFQVQFDQLEAVRVGQPYWFLHQGDCVHAFIVEQIRAHTEDESVTSGQATSSMPVGFPRVTWLSTPTMLRFAADNKENYGIGHSILHSEGHVLYSYEGTGPPTTRGAEQARNMASTNTMGRSKRKDESLLRTKQGKCFACGSRKARIGILGGDRVQLLGEQLEGKRGQKTVIDGLDEHLVTLCPPCTALLGVPTVTSNSTPAEREHPNLSIDWDAVNKNPSRAQGWTIFPLY